MSFWSVFVRYQLVLLGVAAAWLGVAAGFHFLAGCSPGNALLNAVAVMAVPVGMLLDRTGKGGAVFAPAMASGVLFWLSFFPANLGPLMYVALVPFLALVRADGVSVGRRYSAAWLGGVVFAFLAMKWLRVAHPMMALLAWPGMTLWCSLFWPLALLLLRKLDRLKLPFALTLPVVWVALEYFRDHFPTGYPFMKPLGMYQLAGFGWYALAYSQHAVLPLIQAADLGGTYLISATVAAVNGAGYEWALRSKAFRRWVRLPAVWHAHTFHRELWVTALAFGSFGLTMGYGTYRLIHPAFEVGPRVAALQESIPQNAKMGDQIGLFDKFDNLCRRAADAGNRPDLILWPETCYPFADITLTGDAKPSGLGEGLEEDYELQVGDPARAKKLRDNLAAYMAKPVAEREALPESQRMTPERVAEIGKYAELLELGRSGYAKKYWKNNVLLGLSGIEWDGTTRGKFNSARLIRADGTPGPRYDKMHLVPFGEYLPFRETFPFMKVFSPYPDPNYSNAPGENFTRFTFGTLRPKGVPGAELPAPSGEPKENQYTFGVLICYEDTDPNIARKYNQFSGQPDPADFLVNISNDGWFDGSEQHELHVAICRFRAVEARRSIVRAVNMGISCIIDPDGRVTDWAGEPWGGSKKVKAILAGGVVLDTRGSPYAFLGDWVPAVCWSALLLGLFAGRRRERRFLSEPDA